MSATSLSTTKPPVWQNRRHPVLGPIALIMLAVMFIGFVTLSVAMVSPPPIPLQPKFQPLLQKLENADHLLHDVNREARLLTR